MNVERDVGQCTIWKFTNFWMTSQLQWFWKTCRKTHNLKIHKWSEGKSIALNENRGAGRRTISKSEMIGWLVDCNVCGKRCRRGHNLKIHKWSDVKSIAINVEWIAGQRTILRLENDRIASRLQSMWKEMQNNAQFQNQKMIEWQVDCNKCGIRCKKTHNLKIHKWSEDKPIAMNVERDAGGGTIWKFPNDRMSSWLQQMWNELQDNAQFQG